MWLARFDGSEAAKRSAETGHTPKESPSNMERLKEYALLLDHEDAASAENAAIWLN